MSIQIILAQTDLSTGLGKIAGILNAISMVLFFGALILSSLMYATGRTEHLKSGIIGAGIGGLAWIITKTLFQAAGGVSPGIELQGF